MRLPDEETVRRIEDFLRMRFRENARFDGRFPDDFEESLFLYPEVMLIDQEVFHAVFRAAEAIGEMELVFLAKEIWGNPAEQQTIDRVVPIREAHEPWEHTDVAFEFYLASLNFEWLVWAYRAVHSYWRQWTVHQRFQRDVSDLGR